MKRWPSTSPMPTPQPSIPSLWQLDSGCGWRKQGLPQFPGFWTSTAPSPVSLTSVSTTKGALKFGWPRTGGFTRCSLSVSKIVWHVFFFKALCGSAICEKLRTNQWDHPAMPRNLCKAFRLVGTGKLHTASVWIDMNSSGRHNMTQKSQRCPAQERRICHVTRLPWCHLENGGSWRVCVHIWLGSLASTCLCKDSHKRVQIFVPWLSRAYVCTDCDGKVSHCWRARSEELRDCCVWSVSVRVPVANGLDYPDALWCWYRCINCIQPWV